MTKIYIPLPSKNNLDLFLEQTFDGFFIGIKDYSSNFNIKYSVDEISELLNKINKKETYIIFDRLYYNEEIDSLRDILKEVIKLDITGIGYTDVAVLNILNELGFNKKIIWISNHLGTNSSTINFLGKRNVSKALLSNEITCDEIISINNNTNVEIGVKLYGFLNMATSSRKLLSNYFKYNKLDKNGNKYYLKDKIKDDRYIIIEDYNSNFYTGRVLNGIKYFPRLIENNIDYVLLDSYLLDELSFYNIIEAFSSLRNEPNDNKFIEELYDVVNSNTYFETFDGFLNKKTVVKVKDYE